VPPNGAATERLPTKICDNYYCIYDFRLLTYVALTHARTPDARVVQIVLNKGGYNGATDRLVPFIFSIVHGYYGEVSYI
jgi:hypothetical protein